MFIDNIEKDSLLKPLQTVVGVVERKQPLPILSNVLIEKIGSNIQFISTDLEIQISTQIAYEGRAGKDESITVSAKKLQEILRVLPEKNKVSLNIQDNRLQVKADKSKFNLQTLPACDFPRASVIFDQAKGIQLKQSELKKLIGMVQYAMAQQDIRYYLNGVLFVIDGMNLRLVATDGHRLAFTSTKLSKEYPKQEVILPRKAINELIKLLGDGEEEVAINFSENQAQIFFSKTTMITKLIDGKFPDYERVIPTYSNHLILNRLIVMQALQRAAILSNEKFRGVRFILTEKNLCVISSNSEQEEAQEDIETDYHGAALDIGFNVNYLLDGLNSTSSEKIIFSFGDPNSSILISIQENEAFKYVVMPMRI